LNDSLLSPAYYSCRAQYSAEAFDLTQALHHRLGSANCFSFSEISREQIVAFVEQRLKHDPFPEWEPMAAQRQRLHEMKLASHERMLRPFMKQRKAPDAPRYAPPERGDTPKNLRNSRSTRRALSGACSRVSLPRQRRSNNAPRSRCSSSRALRTSQHKP
jgi:hypothetical protein